MKNFLVKIITFLHIFSFAITAFDSSAVTPSNNIKEPEDGLLEVLYTRKAITDTTKKDIRFALDDVILRVGKNKSMFCGIKRLWADSLSTVDYSSFFIILNESLKRKDYLISGRYTSYIYKDFSNKTCKEYEYFDMEYWKYSEELNTPEWIVCDSVKNIIGYECFMATTDFKGRSWTAWFTPEIPISDGPWKLNGLPGLILEAYDASHDYEFEAKGLRLSGMGAVGYMEYKDYNEVTREKHMENWWKYKHKNIATAIQAAYGIKVQGTQGSDRRTPKYDREEIDYDHSLK